jgi:hypothetical protein
LGGNSLLHAPPIELLTFISSNWNLIIADVFVFDDRQNKSEKKERPKANGTTIQTQTVVSVQADTKRKTSLEHPSFLLSVPQIMVTDEAQQERDKERRKHRMQQFSCADSTTLSSSDGHLQNMEKQSPCKTFRKWMMRNSHRLL